MGTCVTAAPTSVDEYLQSFPVEVAQRLARVRAIVHEAFPGATETIRYGMPAVMFGPRHGLHFAGWKKHIGLYPVPVVDGPLESAVAPYRSGKDSVNLPHNKPLPDDLVGQIARAIAARQPR
jgi:uncharacterized protein YdhG (YjbR/CyaY superfamily)